MKGRESIGGGGGGKGVGMLSNYNLNASPNTDKCALPVLTDLHSRYNLDQHILAPS